MEGVPWDNMFQYGFSVLAFLILFFAPTVIDTGETSNLGTVELIRPENTSYADSENLTVTVSGETSLTDENSELVINSTNYDTEKGFLEIDLAENTTELENLSAKEFEKINYSVKASFTKNLPDQVIVSGVLGEPEAFTP